MNAVLGVGYAESWANDYVIESLGVELLFRHLRPDSIRKSYGVRFTANWGCPVSALKPPPGLYFPSHDSTVGRPRNGRRAC